MQIIFPNKLLRVFEIRCRTRDGPALSYVCTITRYDALATDFFVKERHVDQNESGKARLQRIKARFLLMNVLAWYCTFEAEGCSYDKRCDGVDFGALKVTA